jgi:hypothetical protein
MNPNSTLCMTSWPESPVAKHQQTATNAISQSIPRAACSKHNGLRCAHPPVKGPAVVAARHRPAQRDQGGARSKTAAAGRRDMAGISAMQKSSKGCRADRQHGSCRVQGPCASCVPNSRKTSLAAESQVSLGRKVRREKQRRGLSAAPVCPPRSMA